MPGQGYDWKVVEERWQRRWEEAKVFEARADESRPKYFVNTPYPYVDGLLHLGQGATFLHADIMARYKRMRGYNVLFPHAFHCTGLPILGAAGRIREGDPTQIEILQSMGIPEDEIPRFADPLHWIRVFPEETKADLVAFGAGVDWRRSFITTELNPRYDAFVKWQFRKLKEGDYVRLGKHPVIWCPKDQIPIGDHDRLEGEGEVPLEFTLLKFRLRGRFIVTATLRPETIFGTTNVWVDPDVEYAEATVDGERWIITEKATLKLRDQGKVVEVVGKVKGAHLVGQSCIVPLVGDPVQILPGSFIDQSIGTGIVSSVPSDAPDDLVALREVQADEETLARFQLDIPFVRSLDPIPIIEVEGFGPLPAEDVVKRMGIRSQGEREKLQEAKEEVYRTEYYSGTMGKRCGDFAGMKVEEAKERVRAEMLERGEADSMFEPSGPVICRCTTDAVVKVVEDQWFLAYNDAEWKGRTHEAIDSMGLYPETVRKQFHYVVDWLRDWACTHHQGLGTKLPWDDHWVIESLSDSTIYMAFYTVSHLLGKVDPEKLKDDLFDLIFLGKGTAEEVARSCGIARDLVEEMSREFNYWYPFDLRQSGKDLVPNHFTFCLFNHVAIFPKERWPRSFGVNGYLSLKPGVKMSKSRPGAVHLRDSLKTWGADATRITLAQGGEGLDDPTYDEDYASTVGRKLSALYDVAVRNWDTSEEWRTVDSWFRSVLHRAIADTAEAMEALNHRTALKHAFFDLQRNWAWYLRRCGEVPNESLLREFLDVQTRLLAPFVPHLGEEMWRSIGGQGLVQIAPYPSVAKEALDARSEALEGYLLKVVDDVRQIIKAINLTPSRAVFYTAPAWKRELYERAVELRLDDRLEVATLVKLGRAMPGAEGKVSAFADFCKRLVKDIASRGPRELEGVSWTFDEGGFLKESVDFIRSELGAEVEIFEEEEDGAYDPRSKASQSIPWRPAIFVE